MLLIFLQNADPCEQFKKGECSNAMNYYRQALELDQTNVDALVARGALYNSRKQYPLACKDLEEAFRLDPVHKNAKNYLIQILFDQASYMMKMSKSKDELDRASLCLERILTLDSSHVEARKKLDILKKPSVWAKNEQQQPKSIDEQIRDRLEPKAQAERDLDYEISKKLEELRRKKEKKEKDKKRKKEKKERRSRRLSRSRSRSPKSRWNSSSSSKIITISDDHHNTITITTPTPMSRSRHSSSSSSSRCRSLFTATERAPTLAQLAKLLVDPHSAFMTERHEKYTNRLIQFMVNRGGVLLSELVELFKVIELFEERIEKNTVYGECLIEFINLMGGALLKSKTSDEQQYMRVAIDAMEQLALLLRVPFLNVRKSIIETILSFWEQRPNVPIRRVGGGGSGRGGAGMYRTCSKEFHEAVIEHSKVVSTLVQAMPLLQPDEHILALVVLEQLTRNSAANVASIVSCRGAQLIALLLPEAHKSHVPMLIDILWHCVQHAQDKTKCIEQLSARTSISALNAVFERIMKSAHSKAEKETRNDLLVLMTQLARHNPSAPFVETSFLREIISFGCSGKRNLTNSEVDFEFLRMLLTCAVILAEGDGAALRHVKATKLLDYLLLPVQQLEERKKETRSLYQWSGAQKEELQLLSLQLLTKLAPRMKDKFVEQNGCQLLMSFLFWSFQTDYMGHGNSILAMGGRGSARAQCRFCLRCIRSLCTPLQEDDATGIIEGFVNEGIVDLLLLTLSNVNGIDQDPASDSFVYIEDDHIDLEIQEDMLVILSLVADINQKEMMNSNLIPILVYYLRTLPGRVVNGVRRQQLLLSVLDCIFSAVLGHEEAEIAFLEKEGAFLLIDLLEHLPQEMHSVVLTALIELTENPASMTHLMTWRSSQAAKGDQPPLTLVQLLVKLWREEEKRIGAHRGTTGQLTNVDYPMAGAAQIRQSTNHNQSELSPALAEMGENVRAKIYCLMFRIGFNDQLPGVTTGDYVTLALIEKYYDFKVSEVWNEVIDELTQEGISLIDADSEAAETIKQAQSERAKGIQNLQDQLKQAKIMQDKADEQFLFEKIREKYRQSARLTARWYDYIERTSNYSKLEAAKAEMSRQIEQSKTRSKENQKTINHLNRVELNTTTFQGRHMYVESTPSAITRTPDPQY